MQGNNNGSMIPPATHPNVTQTSEGNQWNENSNDDLVNGG